MVHPAGIDDGSGCAWPHCVTPAIPWNGAPGTATAPSTSASWLRSRSTACVTAPTPSTSRATGGEREPTPDPERRCFPKSECPPSIPPNREVATPPSAHHLPMGSLSNDVDSHPAEPPLMSLSDNPPRGGHSRPHLSPAPRQSVAQGYLPDPSRTGMLSLRDLRSDRTARPSPGPGRVLGTP